ncbi:hypothetical protein GGQ84_000391 [Desulfitispora alkaliphila]|uniref:TSUP family transporter n=1 Tax=Desulfitispora alkaliphila TaxID=622674 RepID=UPI003D1901FE
MHIEFSFLLAILVTFAGTVKGITGAGFALAFLPFALLLFPMEHVVIYSLFFGLFGSPYIWFLKRDEVRYDLLKYYIQSAILGIIMGFPVLYFTTSEQLRIIVSVAIIVGALMMVLSKEIKPFKNEKKAMLVAGNLSGILSITSSLAGPPLMMLLAKQRLNNKAYRATIAACFTFVFSFSFIMWLFIDSAALLAVVGSGIPAIPFLFLGIGIGMKIFHLVPAGALSRCMLYLLIISGVFNLIRGLYGI